MRQEFALLQWSKWRAYSRERPAMQWQWNPWAIWGPGEGSWDTGQSKMITTVPPGNLTDYVNNKEKKTFLTKDQRVIRPTSGRLLRKPQSLSCEPARRKPVNNRIRGAMAHRHEQNTQKQAEHTDTWHTQTGAEQGKTPECLRERHGVQEPNSGQRALPGRCGNAASSLANERNQI